MSEEVNEIIEDCEQSMVKAIDLLKRELSRIRTGRANLTMLDGIKVEFYGTPTPLNQVAALTVVDPRLITVKPWDKSLLQAIEKAVNIADIGITPSSDGELVRLPIPPLTAERRKDLVKNVKKTAEDGKIRIRDIRRDSNELMKEVKGLPEDDLKKALKTIQDKTDHYTKVVDSTIATKEKEILDV